jgi:hypothetical protein
MTLTPPHFFEGIVTALEPISHSAGSNGITTEFRREKYRQLDGTSADVTVIAGNAMRGMLRDAGMHYMCQLLGYGMPDESGKPRGLSVQAFHLLFSGGSLGGQTSRGLDIDFARRYRELIPLLSVFGAASGNQMLDGLMKTGFLKPICRETSHLIHPRWLWKAYDHVAEMSDQMGITDGTSDEGDEAAFCAHVVSLTGIPWPGVQPANLENLSRRDRKTAWLKIRNALPSTYSLTDEIMSTRKDDEKNDKLRPMIAPDVRKLLDDERRQNAAKKLEKGQTDVGRHQQMRYYTEVLAAGTKFYWYLQLDGDASTVEYEAFWSALGAWAANGSYIGGKSGTGHGKVAIHFDDWRSIKNLSLHATEETGIGLPLGAEYRRHIEANADAIRSAIAEIQ